MNSVDTILNLAWAIACVAALGWHTWRDCQAGVRNQGFCSRRTLSVILAALSLFPCISATDDRVRLAEFDWSADRPSCVGQNQPHNLQLEDPACGQTPPG